MRCYTSTMKIFFNIPAITLHLLNDKCRVDNKRRGTLAAVMMNMWVKGELDDKKIDVEYKKLVRMIAERKRIQMEKNRALIGTKNPCPQQNTI